jgi:hypothetical protein
MLKQFPIKKEYLLVVAALLLLLLSYQLAFKKTIEAWRINHHLKAQLAQATDVAVQPGYLQRQNSNLSKIINRYKTDTVAFRSNIISNISSIAEKEHVKLIEVPVSNPAYHTDQLIIQRLNFEGDFFALTKVFSELQSAPNIGMVRAATYKLTGLNSNEAKKLVLEVYLETVK